MDVTVGWEATGKATNSGGLVGAALRPSMLGLGLRTIGSSSDTSVGTSPKSGAPYLLEGLYNTLHPSASRPDYLRSPDGHWHVAYSHAGRLMYQQWNDTPLEEDTH